jgi:hypothetical protein
VALGNSGCVSKDFGRWVENVDQLRKTALEKVPTDGSQAKLSQDRQLAFKAYFSALAVQAYSLKDDPSKAKDLDSAFASMDVKTVCAKTLITRTDWLRFEKACTKNGFFLCAEEVQAYPEIVASVRSQLHGESLAKFDAEPACKGAL